jgi:3'-phosphoadenosine 5'-phosphosulfate sulfotransferase (PAPS reductase)/FAD synthetase
MNIFNLSFGKDSMATLILAAEQGIPIDRVMYCEIKFNDEISGEHPLMAEWIPTAERRLKELFGITVDHAYSGVSFEEQFYKVKQKGNHAGDRYGFPYVVGAWCNDRLKLGAISKYQAQFGNNRITQFVGIAYDEPIRWERMKKKETEKCKYRSLLVEQNLTEQDAFEICKRYDLLSPIYSVDGIYRGGCWFCPKQCLADLHSLWKNYPKLWQKLCDIEPESHNTFKPNCTLAELQARFENGYIPKRKKVKQNFIQTSMFDYEKNTDD